MKLFGDQLPKWGGWKANLQWRDTDISHHSLCQVHGPLFEKRADFLDVCTISLGDHHSNPVKVTKLCRLIEMEKTHSGWCPLHFQWSSTFLAVYGVAHANEQFRGSFRFLLAGLKYPISSIKHTSRMSTWKLEVTGSQRWQPYLLPLSAVSHVFVQSQPCIEF